MTLLMQCNIDAKLGKVKTTGVVSVMGASHRLTERL